MSLGIGTIFNSTKIAVTDRLSCNKYGGTLIGYILDIVFLSNPNSNIDEYGSDREKWNKGTGL